ncbi:CHAT domain-containing protein [Anabaena sp. WA102]|uniref:CHAT domain-containing protein n=1 Tax=Anabaena sp. WA102 TaxID=1647413 RepID=UPI0006ABFBB1|nr:CHAT domain-containing protein [Anabaena sp. WA102]
MLYRFKSLSLVTLVLSLSFPVGVAESRTKEIIPTTLTAQTETTEPRKDEALGLNNSSFLNHNSRINQVLAQKPNNQKTQAEKLLQKGEELLFNEQSQAALQSFQQALKIYRRINNSLGAGESIRLIGRAYYNLKDEKKAMTYFDRALQIAETIKNRELKGKTLLALGVLYSLKEPKRAISYYEEALKIAKAINNFDLQARVNFNLGREYQIALGNDDRADKYYQESMINAQKSKNHDTKVWVLFKLGSIYSLRNAVTGINLLEQALVIVRQNSNSTAEKQILRKYEPSLLIALGRSYFFGFANALKKDPEALIQKQLQYYKEAVTVAKETGAIIKQGEALVEIAKTYKGTESSKALAALEQAAKIFQQENNTNKLQDTLYTLGSVYQEIGQLEKSLTYYQQALAVVEKVVTQSPLDIVSKNWAQADIFDGIARVYLTLSKYEKSIEFYQQSVDVWILTLKYIEGLKQDQKNLPFQNLYVDNTKRFIRGGYLSIASNYSFLGQFDQVRKNIQLGEAYSDSSSDSSSDSKDQNLKSALADLEKWRSLRLGFAVEAYALSQVGIANAELGNNDLALKDFQQAIKLSENFPATQANIFFSIGLFYTKQGQYDLAISFHEKGVAAAQKANNKVLQALILHEIGINNFDIGNLPKAVVALYEAITIYESVRIDLTDKSQISIFEGQSTTYTILQKSLIAQNKFQEALEVAERGRARAFVNLLTSRISGKQVNQLNVQPPTIEKIQKIAREQNATIVEYTISHQSGRQNYPKTWNRSEMYIWVVKPTKEISFKQVDLTTLKTPLVDLVKNSRFSMGAGGRGVNIVPTGEPVQKENLQTLHKILIAPIASLLPTKPEEKVIFIPHESLFLVPFVALQDKDGKYLIEKHTILTAPAIQVLDLTNQQRQKVRGKDILVMGNPEMPKVGIPPEQLDPLKGAEKETLAIAKFFQDKLLKTKAITGKDATKAAFKQKLSSARIIHLATHGLLADTDKSIPTAIALAPTKNDDGLLTPAEIIDLSINAELVVLSACDTGRGAITGDGVVGLSRSLITAGASSVIVSLWAVPDTPTAELMTEFYQQWRQNPDKAVALRNAMLNTMKKRPAPVNWAAFTLIGESK